MKRALLGVLLAALLCSGGCWDKRELDQLALVVGVGIDTVAGDRLRLTVELAERQGTNPAESRTIAVTADSLETAQADLSLALDKTPYWGGVVLVILGEEVSEEDAAYWCQCLYRISWFGCETPVIRSEGTAEEAYTLSFGGADYVAQGVSQALAFAAKDSKTKVHTLFDEVEQGMSEQAAATRPQLNVDAEKTLVLEKAE